MTARRVQAAHPLEPDTFEVVLDREQTEYVHLLLAAEASNDSGARFLATALDTALRFDALVAQDPEPGDGPPPDPALGWKPYGALRERWWTGTQWTESYRPTVMGRL